MSNAAKNFNILAIDLSVLHNYFVSLVTFLIYPAQILDLLAPFFLYSDIYMYICISNLLKWYVINLMIIFNIYYI